MGGSGGQGFRVLEWIDGSLSINSITPTGAFTNSFFFDALFRTDGDVTIQNVASGAGASNSFLLLTLKHIGGPVVGTDSLTVDNVDGITNLNMFAALQTVHGDLTITGNSALTGFGSFGLVQPARNNRVYGSIDVSSNTGLTCSGICADTSSGNSV